MKIELDLVSAVVIEGAGPDSISLEIALPSSLNNLHKNLYLDFNAKNKTGAKYVKEHFGIDPEVIRKSGR